MKNKSFGFAKKIIIIIIAIAILAIISFVGERKGYFYPSDSVLSQEEILAKQMEELDKLRQENGANPLTQEEINNQAKELDGLKQKNPSLTQEQIDKQAKELDALREATR